MSSISPLSSAALSGVQVELTLGKRRVKLGTAAQALRDERLTVAERLAVRSMVRAVQLLRERVGQIGTDDARTASTLILRDPEADSGGPWASEQGIAIGRTNALGGRTAAGARRGVLLPVDVALHELTHVIQFRGMGANAKPHPGLLEGIADSVAMLVTGDSLLGEDYFEGGVRDIIRGAVRNLEPNIRRPGTVDVLGPTLTKLEDATRAGVGEHDAGGVVSTIFVTLWRTCGRDVAQSTLWNLIRDPASWKQGGSWASFTAGLRRAAATSGDSELIAVVEREISRAGLDAAKR